MCQLTFDLYIFIFLVYFIKPIYFTQEAFDFLQLTSQSLTEFSEYRVGDAKLGNTVGKGDSGAFSDRLLNQGYETPDIDHSRP